MTNTSTLAPSLLSQLKEEPEVLYGFKVISRIFPFPVWMTLCEDNGDLALFVSDEPHLPLIGPEGETLSTSKYQDVVFPVATTMSGAIAQARELKAIPLNDSFYENLRFIYCKKGDSWDLIPLEEGDVLPL